jgi:hypothetical protein
VAQWEKLAQLEVVEVVFVAQEQIEVVLLGELQVVVFLVW